MWRGIKKDFISESDVFYNIQGGGRSDPYMNNNSYRPGIDIVIPVDLGLIVNDYSVFENIFNFNYNNPIYKDKVYRIIKDTDSLNKMRWEEVYHFGIPYNIDSIIFKARFKEWMKLKEIYPELDYNNDTMYYYGDDIWIWK